MTKNDPILAATREVLALALTEMRGCIEGLSPEALNWRPGAEDTNSLAVLAAHSLGATRSWLARAMGASLPRRDRDAEFEAAATDAAAVLTAFDVMARECSALLELPAPRDWGTIAGYILEHLNDERTWMSVADGTGHVTTGGDRLHEVASAWALMHALEHLREHEGQMFLTRQLWDQRGA